MPGQQLDCQWLAALEEAIQMGIEMQDELYDQQGVNVTPEEAVDAVGSICQVRGITKEYNVFGANPVAQLENAVCKIIQEKQSFHIIVVNDMAMSIIVDSKGAIIFVDSHLHGSMGALIARCVPYQGHQARWFSIWFDGMLSRTWGVGLSLSTISTVSSF